MSNDLDFDAFLNEMESGSGGQGKPGFAKIALFTGWKSLAAGLTPDQTFEPFTNDTEKATALEALNKRLVEAQPGIDLKNGAVQPKVAFGIKVYADTVAGGPWAKDMVQVVCSFMDSWKGVGKEGEEGFKPGIAYYLSLLRKSGKLPAKGWIKDYWCKFVWIPDPGGRLRTPAPVAAGEEPSAPQVRLYVVPVDMYPTKEAMLAVASEAGQAAASGEPIPEGYSAEIWSEYKPNLVKELEEGKWAPPVVNKVSKEYDIPAEWLKANLKK